MNKPALLGSKTGAMAELSRKGVRGRIGKQPTVMDGAYHSVYEASSKLLPLLVVFLLTTNIC